MFDCVFQVACLLGYQDPSKFHYLRINSQKEQSKLLPFFVEEAAEFCHATLVGHL